MKFGDVVRRKHGPTVMWIGTSFVPYETDEMSVNPGMDIGFTLSHNGYAEGDYWPLHGTASAGLLKQWLKDENGERLP